MWRELSLIHGKPSSVCPLIGTVWRTCLRQVHFLPPGDVYGFPVENGEFYRGTQAHRFLVEVCSGLHSPLLGETEIFGQFKAFREAQVWHSAWAPLLDAVEEDVKKIRRTHLTNLGSQSYGSLTRKRLVAGEPVVMVGAGRLAKDILPWLENHPVTLLVRNPAKVDGWKGPVLSFADALGKIPPKAAWLIAAPISNDALETLWLENAPTKVLDFRGEARMENRPARQYYDLDTLFAELELLRSAQAARRERALQAASEASRTREVSVVHRPYGWEDAFA